MCFIFMKHCVSDTHVHKHKKFIHIYIYIYIYIYILYSSPMVVELLTETCRVVNKLIQYI